MVKQLERRQKELSRWKFQEKNPKINQRGRPKNDPNKPLLNQMNIEELYKRVAYLELENEFLKN